MLTFPRGIKTVHEKQFTEDKPIVRLPAPPRVYINLNPNIGKPAIPVVAIGDFVKAGQLIAKADGKMSVNIYASISGKIANITERATISGEKTHIIIDGDGEASRVFLTKLSNDASGETILKRIEEAGVLGMGGAGFPTHVKLSPPKGLSFDMLVVNCVECEAYITCDDRIMQEYTSELIEGIRLAEKAANVNRVIIGIEDNKPKAYEMLCVEAEKCGGIEIMRLKTKYPQGGEKQLIYATTKRKVPSGGLPANVGVVVLNAHTCLAIYEAVILGKPLYERVMTVSGNGVENPQNLLVPSGTLYDDIVMACGGYSDKPTVKIVSGGPMMGVAVGEVKISSTMTTSSLLLLTKEQTNIEEASACINCAKCAKVCPMHLMPMFICSYIAIDDLATARKYGALDCINCGCCSYVCPANREVAQGVKLAKVKITNFDKANGHR